MRLGSGGLGIGVLASGITWTAAVGHYYMLLPSQHSGRRGHPVTVSLVLGHPYERDLSSAPAAISAYVRRPNGKRESVVDKLTRSRKTCPVSKKTEVCYRLTYVPAERGDYVISADSKAQLDNDEFRQDHTKTILHVQSQNGWDGASGQMMEWIPLTRPYGIEAGFVFQARLVRRDGGTVDGVEVEIEQYLPRAPHEDDLPAGEMITRTAKTDPNGVVTYTLDEPGWWLICGTAESPKQLKHEGKEYKTLRRAILMVHVEERFRQKLR